MTIKEAAVYFLPLCFRRKYSTRFQWKCETWWFWSVEEIANDMHSDRHNDAGEHYHGNALLDVTWCHQRGGLWTQGRHLV